MAYNTNPFLERMSERKTSDLDFVRLFSPIILEKLQEDSFKGAVHIFRSAPGAGKTTLLRAFTPTALREFWNSRDHPEMAEAVKHLAALGVLDNNDGPQFLGILLSCASGYADLPPGVDIKQEGLFRALLDCRIVLRTLRSLGSLLGFNNPEQLDTIRLEYKSDASDLKGIPLLQNAKELVAWAEQREQQVYAQLDALSGPTTAPLPIHLRFEGPLWLQMVTFLLNGKPVAPKRLLMIDDLHKLRRKQRELLIDELAVQRSSIPIWLAERLVAIGNELLSQGIRQGRDLYEYTLEDMWSGPRGNHQFSTFALNILDRRMASQNIIASRSFSQCLNSQISPSEVANNIEKGVQQFHENISHYKEDVRYSEWLARANDLSSQRSIDSLIDLYITRILMIRNESKKQLTLELALPTQELEDKDNSQVRGAAEIFTHEELEIPYYFGSDRLCTIATSNIEELLSLAAHLYAGLQNKQILRKPELRLSPFEQEKILKDAAKRKRDFIPKSHTNGLRAQRLLDSIGQFCRDRTFLPNAPYAPGVTGVRLSHSELNFLLPTSASRLQGDSLLLRVISECVAENLLVTKPSAASTSRDGGTIFYLNRTLCVFYDLPLQQGGWQDVSATNMTEWMERGYTPNRQRKMELD